MATTSTPVRDENELAIPGLDRHLEQPAARGGGPLAPRTPPTCEFSLVVGAEQRRRAKRKRDLSASVGFRT
jgi:hypothetical protein